MLYEENSSICVWEWIVYIMGNRRFFGRNIKWYWSILVFFFLSLKFFVFKLYSTKMKNHLNELKQYNVKTFTSRYIYLDADIKVLSEILFLSVFPNCFFSWCSFRLDMIKNIILKIYPIKLLSLQVNEIKIKYLGKVLRYKWSAIIWIFLVSTLQYLTTMKEVHNLFIFARMVYYIKWFIFIQYNKKTLYANINYLRIPNKVYRVKSRNMPQKL